MAFFGEITPYIVNSNKTTTRTIHTHRRNTLFYEFINTGCIQIYMGRLTCSTALGGYKFPVFVQHSKCGVLAAIFTGFHSIIYMVLFSTNSRYFPQYILKKDDRTQLEIKSACSKKMDNQKRCPKIYYKKKFAQIGSDSPHLITTL